MLRHLYINLILQLFMTGNVFCQAVTAAYGPIFTKTNSVVPIINEGEKDFSNTAGYAFSVSYEHFFKEKNYSVLGYYTKFDGCTFIFYEEGGVILPDGASIDGNGFCGGVDMTRVDVGMAYHLINKNRKFYFSPFFTGGLQISKMTGVEIYSDLFKINGPNYFELEPISAEPLNTTQIVPSLGFRTGFVFWKRLDIGLSFQGVYAFKPYQKMYLKYQYKGVVQPTAEYEATGTGLFVTLGVGYRFAKFKK